jgi:HTH-type transcriptional regulator / antitoxin HipB
MMPYGDICEMLPYGDIAQTATERREETEVKVRSTGDLAAIVRGRRLELGLSQAELANRTGVSRKWLLDVERGKASSDFGLLLRVLDALRLALDVVARDGDEAPGSSAAAQLDAILDEHRGPAASPRDVRGVDARG